MSIFVVSGLPRSGTSMMMRALEAGGLQALTDRYRRADDDNPNGYYELEAVKKTKEDPSWVTRAEGKVVKMVYSLIYDLPHTYHYKVIVMRRQMDEILASQEKMLARRGFDKGPPDDVMKKLFEQQLSKFKEWSQPQQHLELLEVRYRDIIETPRCEFERVAAFLGVELDCKNMVDVIDPSLYRNRRELIQ